MKRSERVKCFGDMLAQARCDAKKTQEWLALELGVSRRTVQNWESGQSCPTLFDALEWFRELGLNPFPYFLSFLHPLNKATDTSLDLAFAELAKSLSPQYKEALIYLFAGDHGSSPYSVLQLVLAHMHTPLAGRISNAILISSQYDLSDHLSALICPDNILPDMENLREAIRTAERSVVRHNEKAVDQKI